MKIIRKTIKNILFFLAPSVTDRSWSVLSAIRFHHLLTNFPQKRSKIIFIKKYCGSFINNRNSYQWLLALGILYKVFLFCNRIGTESTAREQDRDTSLPKLKILS